MIFQLDLILHSHQDAIELRVRFPIAALSFSDDLAPPPPDSGLPRLPSGPVDAVFIDKNGRPI